MTPYLLMTTPVIIGMYILLYMLVTQGLFRSLPLPVFAIRHFFQVEQFFKAHVFDSIPSGDSLV